MSQDTIELDDFVTLYSGDLSKLLSESMHGKENIEKIPSKEMDSDSPIL